MRTCAAALLTGLAAVFGALAFAKLPPALEGSEQRARINEMIQTLRRETFQDSMNKLALDDQAFMDPGYLTDSKFREDNLEEMLSNRRAVKLLSQIAAMPAEARSDKCVLLYDTI